MAGCFIVASNQLFSAHDPLSVWLPTAVSGCMQLSLFCLATYFQCSRGGRGTAVHTATEGLLGAGQEGGGCVNVPPQADPSR